MQKRIFKSLIYLVQKRIVKSLIYLVVLFLSCVGTTGLQAQEKTSFDVTVCNLPVPRSIKRASANFSITYSFQLRENGTPTNITKVIDSNVGAEPVETCLLDWRIKGLTDGTKLLATQKWKHGKGWTELIIFGNQIAYVIKIKEGLGY
jgi:hypothetical protein